jgi:DnaJ-class molecular chaperone
MSYSGDPRVPVTCPNCLGGRAILERMELGMLAYLPVVCQRCAGFGTIRIERRSGA